MTTITCYDPEGVAHAIEAVDAREYIKSGYYTLEPKEQAAVAEAVSTPAEPAAIAAPVGEGEVAAPAIAPAVEPVATVEPVVAAVDAPTAKVKAKLGPKPKA